MSGAIYDAAELRRRIVVCFSSHELRELAEGLGVAGVVPADRGASEAARQLVRHYERAGSLPDLVDALRRARPLVEWPDPAPAAEVSGVAPTLLDTPAPSTEGLWVTPDEDTPRSDPAPTAEPSASGRLGHGPASATGSQRAGGWPGTAGVPEAPPPRGLDARILVAVAGLTVVAAVVAFAAGRATTSEAPVSVGTPRTPAGAESAAAASSAPASGSGRSMRPDGPAVRVSAAVMRSVANVARACEVRGPPSDVLRDALNRCGPTAAPPRERAAPADVDAGTEADDAPAGATALPRPAANGPAAVGAPASPCVAGCDTQHRDCQQKCGAEPKHSTEYAEHQQCLGRCLAAASKCRVGCR